jgi:hypothetical protein
VRERIRCHLTYANVISTVCLFLLLGGGTAVALNGTNSVQSDDLGPGAQVKAADVADNAVSSADIANGQVKGADVAEGTLGQVPDAAHADNATDLGGKSASDYRLHCPGNLDRAGDLCYEVDPRPEATYSEALKACALNQRRLPDAGELALVYDHLSAAQNYEWTVGYFTSSGASLADVLGQSSSRVVIPTANTTNVATEFRCVTSATN